MERGNSTLRFFDRWVGPILLWMLAPAKRLRSAKPMEVRSAALLKTAAIGDTVMLSALVEDLRNQSIKVTIFTGGSNYEFAKRLKGVDQVIRLPLTNPFAAISLLRSQSFDLFVDADPWPRISALFTFFAKAHVKVGFKTRGQHRHYGYDITVDHADTKHELENYHELLRAAGIQSTSMPQAFGHPWSAERIGNYIVLHMWPGGINSHLKEWPAERWEELAEKILACGFDSFSFGLTGGPADRRRNDDFIEELPEPLRSRFSNYAGISFVETLKLLQGTRLLVSVNTGVMHVGAAMGVPTVGLHGPTNPHRWGPIGPRTYSVLSQNTHAGTLNLGFEYRSGTDYMSELEVGPVLQACLTMLGTQSDNNDSSRLGE